MTNAGKESSTQGKPDRPKVNLGDLVEGLPSAQPAGELAAGPNVTVLLSDVVATPLRSEHKPLLPDAGKVQFGEDGVVIDETAFNVALNNVNQSLIKAITRGDVTEVERYLWYLQDQAGEEADKFRQQLRDAVQKKDASGLVLDSLTISLPNRGLAEKNLIKEALEEKVRKLPFEFENDAGEVIDQNQTDFIYTQSGGSSILMIGSKRGIHGISVLTEDLDKYQANLDSLEKDDSTGTITINLKPDRSGANPPVDKVIIFKDQRIDLPKELVKREEEVEEEQRRHAPPPPSVSSAPQRSPISQPRAVRPTTWVSTSH